MVNTELSVIGKTARNIWGKYDDDDDDNDDALIELRI
jgi:hypothetical protein